jgi:hypothetical protein
MKKVRIASASLNDFLALLDTYRKTVYLPD